MTMKKKSDEENQILIPEKSTRDKRKRNVTKLNLKFL